MIYIIRHGQTAWNLQNRKQGQEDSPLTLKGAEQAKHISNSLKEEIKDIRHFQFVISPQWRCRQYASLICDYLGIEFKNCIVEGSLREHSFGTWEGLTEEEIESEFPGFLEKRYDSWWDYVVPGGESYELLYNRVSRVVDKYRQERCVFICHEMVSKVARGYYASMEPVDILKLKHPQDTFYILHDEEITTKSFC